MVARKPVPDNEVPHAPRMEDTRQELWSATDSDASADQIWGEERHDQQRDRSQQDRPLRDAGIPNALRPGMPHSPTNYSSIGTEENVWGALSPSSNAVMDAQGGEPDVDRMPTILRPGGAMRPETNPFKRKPAGNMAGTGQGPVTTGPPTEAFSQLSVNEAASNPWKPAVEDSKTGTGGLPAAPSLLDADAGNHVWDSTKPSPQPLPAAASTSPALMSLPSETGSNIWDEEAPKRIPSPAAKVPLDEKEVLEGSHAWDDLGDLDKGKGPAKSPPPIPAQNTGGRSNEWDLVDLEGSGPKPWSRQSTRENFDDPDSTGSPAAPPTAPPQPISKDAAPPLPPRASADQQRSPRPPQPPRPVGDAKRETYQVKNIRWHDVSAAKNPRESPILVQNLNGPCPLVALVNALTLTTPAEENTDLVDTLRTREQVSLSLVMEAVINELLSGRRHNPIGILPDVTELYEFLKGLHTGLNVNPRFVPTEELLTAYKRTSMTHLHPTERTDDMIPGTFEGTREMTLYSTFSVPLIHGWLPSTGDAVDAFRRRAASYEDVQNLLFMEEELEERLSNPSNQGLTEEEQQVYQDILAIKSFLHMYPTQLTPHGLKIINQAMKPGSVAILFRNDHFSTLYRHPQTQQLMTLVTDAGYATHDEVVWESLLDVNGEHTEFFSGDFRVVGGATSSSLAPATDQDGAGGAETGSWTTVQGRRGGDLPATPETEPNHEQEQEDRDLALALQLQEEENERHRAEQARRRQEARLSEQFIEQQGRPTTPAGRGGGGSGQPQQQGRGGTPNNTRGRGGLTAAAPGRTSTSSTPARSSTSVNGAGPGTQTVRSLIPPGAQPRGAVAVNRPAGGEDDDAPPSYEQAAKAPAYVPPTAGGGESSRGGLGQGGQGRIGGVAGNGGRAGVVGARPAVASSPGRERDRECLIM